MLHLVENAPPSPLPDDHVLLGLCALFGERYGEYLRDPCDETYGDGDIDALILAIASIKATTTAGYEAKREVVLARLPMAILEDCPDTMLLQSLADDSRALIEAGVPWRESA